MEGSTVIPTDLLQRIWQNSADLLAKRRLPESTYRVQLHAEFGFRAAAAIVPYLQELGVSDCYASPYLKARPGSKHGYDIIDHGSLNPEIGAEADFNAWVEVLHEHGLGQILDIVPNHMGVATNDNAWWNDILENGPASRYAGHFDIDWQASLRSELQHKVLLPVLGETYGEVLEAGQLKLDFANGTFTIAYFERRFPVDPGTFGMILGPRLDELEQRLGADAPALHELQSILTATRNLPHRAKAAGAKVTERAREKEIIKRRLAALAAEVAPIRAFIAEMVTHFNGTPGTAASFDPLDQLLDQQAYRLSYWRVAPDEINYRRFFDVNDLAALSMEREDVFAAAHGLVLRLAAEGKIGGLRIDHPDGLYDPAQYLRRLQEQFLLACARRVIEADAELASLDRTALEAALRGSLDAEMVAKRPVYVVVEKILGAGEALVESWPVHGTTGYELLNVVNGLFVDGANASAFSRLYHEFIDDDTRFAELVYRKKLLILQAALGGELHMLARQLDHLAQKSRTSRDFTFITLRRALREVIACFPVYRSYIADEGVKPEDRRSIEIAVRHARVRNPLMSGKVLRFVRDMLLLEGPKTFSDADRAEQRRFAGKFQQVTAPVMAKGLEDTTFYVYNRLTSLNEVGGDPGRFGIAPDAVHAFFGARQAHWPHALSSLTTHDTKRSADVRARINVLSEIPAEWSACLGRWSSMNARHRSLVDDANAPDANEEYLLYQTLLGAWPFEPCGAEELGAFSERIKAYMEKAIREAKVHTSWIHANAEHERAVAEFVGKILDEKQSADFLADFRALQRRVSRYGMLNALAQTLLFITAPGVPDIYQGSELWNFYLADPDNRGPVDYARRREMLAGLAEVEPRSLLDTMEDGRIKLYVINRALRCRRDRPDLFATGAYVPLRATGDKTDHLFGFARRHGDDWAIVVIPRLLTKLTPDPTALPLGSSVWGATELQIDGIPAGLRWHDVLANRTRRVDATTPAAELFADLPLALLVNNRSN